VTITDETVTDETKTTNPASTPNYVLIEGNLRIGPKVTPLKAGTECSAIYGFSDKGPYDKFCANSQLALKPYPLVKGYLRNQIDESGDSLKLVVIDAASHTEHCVNTATIEAVLAALQSSSAHVTATHQLTFDEEANAYRVDE
jgi:hypothetical protein